MTPQEQYRKYTERRTNLIISIQTELEAIAMNEPYEFTPLEQLPKGILNIVVLSGFNSVHAMLEDVRLGVEKQKAKLKRIERKLSEIKLKL